jgi:hypothetical protein
MAKTNRFAHGDCVSGKKWNGEHFIGVYEHEYDSGDHAVFDGEKRFCVHKRDCHLANEEETKEIREKIVKPMKEANKASKKKATNIDEELTEDELEAQLTEA